MGSRGPLARREVLDTPELRVRRALPESREFPASRERQERQDRWVLPAQTARPGSLVLLVRQAILARLVRPVHRACLDRRDRRERRGRRAGRSEIQNRFSN